MHPTCDDLYLWNRREHNFQPVLYALHLDGSGTIGYNFAKCIRCPESQSHMVHDMELKSRTLVVSLL